MALLEDFESQLKDIVQAKRLSASKMAKLTEIAMESMSDDTQLVSILYRTHKSLQSSYKVSSLYVFDALARAAKHKVVKQELSAHSTSGNCATFLSKIEGVLDGLFQDMLSSGQQEFKDKTKKILDIWTKGKTFPETTLSRLTKLLSVTNKEPENAGVAPGDPRTAAVVPLPTVEVPPTTPTPPQAHPDTSALLSLLQQAAQQTTANTGVPLSAQQILLQRLAQVAQRQKVNGATLPTTVPPPPSADFANVTNLPPRAWEAGPSQSPPTSNEGTLHNGRDYRYNSPDALNGHNHDRKAAPRDPRKAHRDRDYGQSSRDDRDRFRGRNLRERSPRRTRDSRSRSPPSRYGGRRDVKPYSPPRRPSLTAPVESRNNTEISAHGQKDEFGRDVRSPSPPHEVATHGHAAQPPIISARTPTPSVEPPPRTAPEAPVVSTAPVADASSIIASAPTSQPGLESFNPHLFNPMLPDDWAALGKMWEITNGYSPSQEELMQYMALIVMGQAPQVQPVQVNSQFSDSGGQWQGGGHGRGGYARGRGGYVSGRGRFSGQAGGWNGGDHANHSDGIVLGGGDASDATAVGSLSPQTATGSQAGGSMQRVGGKWVFVKNSG